MTVVICVEICDSVGKTYEVKILKNETLLQCFLFVKVYVNQMQNSS